GEPSDERGRGPGAGQAPGRVPAPGDGGQPPARLGRGRRRGARTPVRRSPLAPVLRRRRRGLVPGRRRGKEPRAPSVPGGTRGEDRRRDRQPPGPDRRRGEEDHGRAAPRIGRVTEARANRVWILTGSLENFRVNVERGF